jgi:hypothetical protein
MGHDGRAYVASRFAREQLARDYLDLLTHAVEDFGSK